MPNADAHHWSNDVVHTGNQVEECLRSVLSGLYGALLRHHVDDAIDDRKSLITRLTLEFGPFSRPQIEFVPATGGASE